MRRICQQSRRWHQQFFPFTSQLGHRQCFQRLWLPGQYQQRQYARKRNDDVVVHEFEQIGTDKKTRVAINPKAEIEETAKYLRSKIESLEKELAVLKEGPFGPNSEFMQSIPPKERQILLEALRQARTKEDDGDDDDTTVLDTLIKDLDLEADDVKGDPAPQVTLQHPKKQQAYVRNFNLLLKDAVADPTPTKAIKAALWQSYQRCRQKVTDFLSMIPARVWDILWQTQTELSDSSRTLKVRALCEDMLSQSLPLSAQQLLVYMECLRSEGDLTTAIACWNENRSILGPNAEVAQRFWTLGVHLYSDGDQPQIAQDIAMQCLKHGSFVDPTILGPVIGSWARRGTMDDLKKSWTCYLRMKAELGTAIRSEDYESISTTLLNQGHVAMALAVFKDMAVDQVKREECSSVSAFRNLVGFVGQMQSSAINEHDVSKVSLTALTALPRFLQNKYFFASWLKKLIEHGDIDAAAKVIELMYERGVRPDAKHVNCLVHAWLRSGSAASQEKGLSMAWAMINARVDYVRDRQTSIESEVMIKRPRRFYVPTFAARPVPRATIETFSILLLHYTRRCQDDLAETLMKTMTEDAMITPNAYIWNHWLYASLRTKDLQSVWIQYQAMKEQVQPDLQTIACLWDTAKVQWDSSKSAHSNKIPTARKLFREMNDWMSQLPEAERIRAGQQFSRALHDQIIRVFCLSSDLRGTLCALHGLKQLFGEYPDTRTFRIVIVQLARLLPPDPSWRPSGRRGSRRRVSKMVRAMSDVMEVLQIVSDQRTVSLMDQGVDPEELDDAAQKQFQLDNLSDILVVVMKRLGHLRRTHVDNEMRMVAKEMGVNVDEIDFREGKLLQYFEEDGMEESGVSAEI